MEEPIDFEKIRAEMKRAVRYRSGPGMMNEVYLGGMATAGMMSRLGGRYGEDCLQKCIDNASERQLLAAYEYQGYQWILGHYREAGSKLYDFEIVKREID